jgi:very-short-patch-repair endonuclease
LKRQEQLRLHAEHPELFNCVALMTRNFLIGVGLLEHPRPLLGAHFSDERKQIQRVNSERNWLDAGYRKKVCKRREMSIPEINFGSLVQEHNLPYQFVGNGEFWLGRRNPDFVHVSDLRLIEIWGDYYHKGQKPEDRAAYFEKFGYQTLVIWASELPMQGSQMVKAQKEKAVLDRVFVFEGGK